MNRSTAQRLRQQRVRDARGDSWRPVVRPLSREELAAARERERMRRWWLDRFTLDEIQELARAFDG